MNILFAQTRTHYDQRNEECCISGSHSQSYSDFWDLVTLSGFPTCYVDEIRLDQDKIYITAPVNGETRPHLENERKRVSNPTARVIWWNLERPASLDEDLVEGANEITKYVDEIWVSDRYFLSFYKGHPKVKHVVMGSDPGLSGGVYWDFTHPKKFNVAPLAAPSYHRYEVATVLKNAELQVAPNRWGHARSDLLRNTHLMLNIHQDGLLIGEPLRFAVAAAHKMPLLSEELKDPYPMEVGKHLSVCDWRQMGKAARKLISNPAMLPMGESLHQLLCHEYRFRKNVESGVQV